MTSFQMFNPFEQAMLAALAMKVRVMARDRAEALEMLLQAFRESPYLLAMLVDNKRHVLRFMDSVKI